MGLFLTFAKIGLFTFGGGYAMISIIADICVEKKKWITHEDMMNITALAESTPGPIAVNCATFVGYRQKGLGGAIAATLGVVLPSFVIIYLIALFLDDFLEITVIFHAFQGIKLAVGILILDAAIRMIKGLGNQATAAADAAATPDASRNAYAADEVQAESKSMVISYIMIGASAVIMLLINIFSLKLSSVVLMLAFGAVSLLLYVARRKSNGLS